MPEIEIVEATEVTDELVAPAWLIDGKDVTWWGVRTVGAVERLGSLVDQLDR